MANGKTHRLVGQVTGAGFAVYRARHQEPLAAMVECLAGCRGGEHGARLHDLLEPATSPNHRNLWHGVAVNGAAVAFLKEPLDDIHERLRTWAKAQVDRALQSETPWWEAAVLILAAGTAHALVGYTNGFVAGAASHLLLDAGTAKGIPLLVRGF